MKAIIIEEERFAEIAELMKLKAMELKEENTFQQIGVSISKPAWGAAINEVHRSMHYQFVTWAQSHGASCIKR